MRHYLHIRVILIETLTAMTAVLAITACAGAAPTAGRAGTDAAQKSSTGSASWRLAGVSFPSSSHGYGDFVSIRSARCRIGVAVTSDSGARFSAPVQVTSWRCASVAQPTSSLAFDTSGDGFLYGPKLFITHDAARSWAPSHQPGQVLAVATDQRSVWLLQASCHPATGPGRCALRLLESADGGRSFAPAARQPGAFAAGFSGLVPAGAAQGQSWLVRTGLESGYVASLTQPGSSRLAGLWFTGNGGRSWSRRSTPCTGEDAALSAAPGGTLFAVCAGEPGAGNQGKTVARSTDGGRTWARPVSCDIGACPGPLGSGYLGSIDAVSPSTVYLVGGRSPLLVSTDGGRRWRVVKAVTAGTDAGTSQVLFTSRSDGFMVGIDNAPPHAEQPAIWRTSDGGAHWSPVHPEIG